MTEEQRQTLDDAQQNRWALNTWEDGFVTDMAAKPDDYEPTEKQAKVIRKIGYKLMDREQMRGIYRERIGISPDQHTAAARSAEIARQTRDFLSRGGEIQEIPTRCGPRNATMFNQTAVIDPVNGRVLSKPPREIVNGRTLLTVQVVSRMCDRAPQSIRKLYPAGKFPKPVSIRPCLQWDEQDILDYLAEQ